ncbi:hypothetical protein ANO11243_093970 [Dothideomycetidae sp. 11243]|nr:hypothetical protein ANO11243_093970 [fungal sp. No.11243]
MHIYQYSLLTIALLTANSLAAPVATQESTMATVNVRRAEGPTITVTRNGEEIQVPVVPDADQSAGDSTSTGKLEIGDRIKSSDNEIWLYKGKKKSKDDRGRSVSEYVYARGKKSKNGGYEFDNGVFKSQVGTSFKKPSKYEDKKKKSKDPK